MEKFLSQVARQPTASKDTVKTTTTTSTVSAKFVKSGDSKTEFVLDVGGFFQNQCKNPCRMKVEAANMKDSWGSQPIKAKTNESKKIINFIVFFPRLGPPWPWPVLLILYVSYCIPY